MKLFELFATLTLDTSAFEASLARAAQRGQAFAAQLRQAAEAGESALSRLTVPAPAASTATSATVRPSVRESSLDLGALQGAMTAAVRAGMQGVGVYVDRERLGEAVAEPVSRSIAQKAYAGRFS